MQCPSTDGTSVGVCHAFYTQHCDVNMEAVLDDCHQRTCVAAGEQTCVTEYSENHKLTSHSVLV